MTPQFLFSSYAVIAVILLIGLMGPPTSIAKPSSTDLLLPLEAQAPPPRQMYTNSSNLQALGNNNQADKIGVVSNSEERATCKGPCGEIGLPECGKGCNCEGVGGQGLVGTCASP